MISSESRQAEQVVEFHRWASTQEYCRRVPDAYALDCTTRQRNTHITEEQAVHYPWHPWHGLSVRVHESLVRRDKAVSRCSIDQSGFLSRLEVPQWMFDRICCRSMHLAERPLVNCDALLELKSLLTSTDGDEAVLEDQHHIPNEEGDADAKATELSTCRPTEPVSSTANGAAVAQASSKSSATSHPVVGTTAPGTGNATRRPRQQQKGDGR